MKYPNATKIFETALGGRHLSDEENLEIQSLLDAMSGAGWPVEDCSSAPFVTIVAFFYARAPKAPDVSAIMRELSNRLDETTSSALAKLEKPTVHLDFVKTVKDSFRGALENVITKASLVTVGILIVLTAWGTHQYDISHPPIQNVKQVPPSGR